MLVKANPLQTMTAWYENSGVLSDNNQMLHCTLFVEKEDDQADQQLANAQHDDANATENDGADVSSSAPSLGMSPRLGDMG